MRNGQNNNKRMRNRSNSNNNNNNNNNRRGQNPMTRVFESNGPDIKIRGTASHVAEKYVQLARDARSSGDPVAAENYYQHAEHYFRLIAAAQEQFRQNQPQPRMDSEVQQQPEDGDDEGESFSHFGQEPGFVPQQQQPFVRENNQREHNAPREQRGDHQPYQREQQQQPREHRPQPQYQPQPQPPAAAGDRRQWRRRPPAVLHHRRRAAAGKWRTGAYEEGRGGERFPRRRRRPHGPRPEMAAPAAVAGRGYQSRNE